jgi:hypothetical protein
LWIADQSGGFDGESPDRSGGESLVKSTEYSQVPPPCQPDDRLRACVVIFVGEPFDEGSSKLGRVHLHLRSQSKGRPISDVGFRVSRQFDEETDGPNIRVSRQGEDDGMANIGVSMATEARRWPDRSGLAEVRQGDQYRPEDGVVLLTYQHLQEGVEARLREGAIRDSELPEDVRSHPAFDRTGATTEPDGPFQDVPTSPPMQGADGIPGEIPVGVAEDGRDQFTHASRIVPRMGRLMIP